MENTRVCWICQEEKALKEYYKDCKDRLGRQKRCKSCNRIMNQKFKNNNPNYSKEYGKEKYRKALKANPLFNQKRYQDKKEIFKNSHKAYRETISGRIKDLVTSAISRAKKKNIPSISKLYLTFQRSPARI